MRLFLSLLLTGLLLGSGSALAQPQSDSAAAQARIAAQNAFQEHPEEGSWTLRSHETVHTPVSIFNGPEQAVQLQGDTPEARARRFFAQYKDMFGLRPDPDELRVEFVRERRGRAYVQLNQQYRGVPVLSGGYKVTMSREGFLQMVSGRFFPGIDVRVRPTLSAEQARRSAVDALLDEPERLGAEPTEFESTEPETKLVIYPGDGSYALAHVVRVSLKLSIQNWLVYVDAHSGEVLKTQNSTTSIAAIPASTGGSDVESFPEPAATAQSTVGSGKVWQNDPQAATPLEKDLPRLDGNGSSLSGTYVHARNYNGSDASPTSGTSTYHFSSTNPDTKEVNL